MSTDALHYVALVAGAAAIGYYVARQFASKPSPPPLAITAEDIRLIRENWGQVAGAFPRIEDVGELFYKTLLESAPEVAAVDGPFYGVDDFASQATKLMSMLESLILLLDEPEKLSSTLFQLGERHALYGVEQWHFPAAGAALVNTLSKGLGTKLGPAHAMAWLKMWSAVETTMVAGSRTPRGKQLFEAYKVKVAKRKAALNAATA